MKNQRRIHSVVRPLAMLALVAAASITAGLAKAQEAIKSTPDVVIYQGEYPAWPWIDKTPSGKLLCVWREGTQHMYSATGKAMLSQSDDGGKTWSRASTIVDAPEIDDRNVAILALSDTDWLVCYNTFTSAGKSCVMTLRTVDGGKSWSEPQPINPLLDARTRAAAVRLSTGELVLPYYKSPGNQALAALSNDNGSTWTTVVVPNTAGFVGDEWSIVEMPDHSLAGIIRNSAPKNDQLLYITKSTDKGRSWSTPAKTNLHDTFMNSPAQIFLHNGRPWVLYDNTRMVSVALATSDDPNLLQWNVDQQIVPYQYRKDRRPLKDGGYPASVALSGNRRLIVDYVRDGDFHAIVGYYVDLPAE